MHAHIKLLYSSFLSCNYEALLLVWDDICAGSPLFPPEREVLDLVFLSCRILLGHGDVSQIDGGLARLRSHLAATSHEPIAYALVALAEAFSRDMRGHRRGALRVLRSLDTQLELFSHQVRGLCKLVAAAEGSLATLCRTAPKHVSLLHDKLFASVTSHWRPLDAHLVWPFLTKTTPRYDFLRSVMDANDPRFFPSPDDVVDFDAWLLDCQSGVRRSPLNVARGPRIEKLLWYHGWCATLLRLGASREAAIGLRALEGRHMSAPWISWIVMLSARAWDRVFHTDAVLSEIRSLLSRDRSARVRSIAASLAVLPREASLVREVLVPYLQGHARSEEPWDTVAPRLLSFRFAWMYEESAEALFSNAKIERGTLHW